MNLLLDTHVFIWCVSAPKRLSDKTRKMIENPSNEVHVSAVSALEIAIKVSLGKLRIPGSIEEQIKEKNFNSLSVSVKHALKVADLPIIHKDPFDRLLIAQAMEENFTLVTSDEEIEKYPNVKILKA